MIFNTADLQSPDGLGYGDMVCGLLEANGYEWTDGSIFAPPGTDSDFTFDHLVLALVVVAYVVPNLDQPVDLVLNPVRVQTGGLLRPERVEVPDDDILRLAATLHRPDNQETTTP